MRLLFLLMPPLSQPRTLLLPRGGEESERTILTQNYWHLILQHQHADVDLTPGVDDIRLEQREMFDALI